MAGGIGQFFTPEYQTQLDDIERKRAIAKALQQRQLDTSTQMVGNEAIKTNPLSHIANLLSQKIGMDREQQASQERVKLANQFQQDSSADLTAVLQETDPQQRIARALASKFPQTQSYGQEFMKQMEGRLGKVGDIIGGYNPQAGAQFIQQGNIQGQVPPVVQQQPEFGQNPQGDRYVTIPDPKNGKPEFKWAPKETKVTATANANPSIAMGKEEGEQAAKMQAENLKSTRERAIQAQNTLGDMQRLTQLVEQGAKVGSGQEYFQALRKFGDSLGIDIPSTGITQSAQQLLANNIISRAKELGHNPSNADVTFIQNAAGNLNTSPEALSEMIAYMSAVSLKGIQDFRSYLGSKENMSYLPPGTYDPEDTGINLPSQLFGPQHLQFNTLQRLQQYGGDITQFRDPTGKPFDKNTRFNMTPSPIAPLGTYGQPQQLPPGVTQIRGPRGR